MKTDLIAARTLRRTDHRKWLSGLREVGARELTDILDDHEFWAEQKRIMIAAVEDQMRDVFDQGVALAKTIDVPGYVARKDFLDPIASEIDDFASHVFRHYVDDWWLQLEYTTREQLRAAITRAAIEGTGVEGVIRDIDPLFGEVRARRIGVTETTRLFGRGAMATYMATGMEGWEWQTVSDSRVCPICTGRAGNQYPIEHPFDPAHVSCLVDLGTLISGPKVLAATRRWYEGEALILRTAEGHDLTITPNHPIATPGGWQAAAFLGEGDYVLTDIDQRPASGFHPDDIDMPTRLEQITSALFELPQSFRLSMPTTAEDFHGDAQPWQGNVDVVSADRLLRFDPKTRRSQVRKQLSFDHARPAPAAFIRKGDPHAFVVAGNATHRGGMGGGNLGLALCDRHAGPFQSLSGRLISERHIGPSQTPAYGQATNTEADSDSVLRNARFVEANDKRIIEWLAVRSRTTRIVEVRRIWIARHVFNLQTTDGWYVANGIITHNCRCFPRPVLRLAAST